MNFGLVLFTWTCVLFMLLAPTKNDRIFFSACAAISLILAFIL